jgi:hypothetical protein
MKAGKRVVRRGRKSSWQGELWIAAQEVRVKGMRVGMRRE